LATNVTAVAGSGPGQGEPTFVFVSGANGHAYAPPEMGLLGLRTVAVDLPGHGVGAGQYPASYQAPQNLQAFATTPSPMAGITLDDFSAVVVAAVRRAAEHGPVILVGTSMGGATISRVGNAVPELLDRIVYDTAFCCVDLPSIGDYLATPEGSTSLLPALAVAAVGNPAEIGASRVNWRWADPSFLASAKACLIADTSDAEFLAVLNDLDPDESLEVPVADSRVNPSTWGRVPHTYIRHSLDRALPIALQDRMIREADALTPHNRFDVHTVETSHVTPVSTAGAVVKILAGLA
jgi:pimeloyl-ACP methyl ester carboxylesterase